MNNNICIVGSNPEFLGGMSSYVNNLIKFIPKKYNLCWVYKGDKNRVYEKNNIKFIEIKVTKIYPLDEISFNLRLIKLMNKNEFDIINSHAIWGFWLKFYKKKADQLIVHTYHGSTYYFFRNHLKRFGLLKGALLFPLLIYSYLIEKPPMKKADKIICVSEHVREEMIKLYGNRKDIEMIRTGVDLREFKHYNKNKARKELNLDAKKIYGLYVGRGGYWTKGLDRVVKLSEEIYKLNRNYRLLVVGADYKKVKNYVEKEFITLVPPQSRDKMPFYYSASDIFFCMSRYEGGSPTMVTSEAMASGCMILTSEDSRQEIFEDMKNGLIIKEDYQYEGNRIFDLLNDKKRFNKITYNSKEDVKKLSLDKWGKEYIKILLS